VPPLEGGEAGGGKVGRSGLGRKDVCRRLGSGRGSEEEGYGEVGERVWGRWKRRWGLGWRLGREWGLGAVG